MKHKFAISSERIIANFLMNGRNYFAPIQQKTFAKCARFFYDFPAFAKNESTAVRSCKELMAHSTPQAYFFMRGFCTPKKRLERFPMVERNRKGFALCCVPLVAVSHPVTFYRQTVRSLAVVPKKLLMELSQMLFKFLLLGETRLTISIRANSEQEARQRFKHSSPMIFIARINQGGVYA